MRTSPSRQEGPPPPPPLTSPPLVDRAVTRPTACRGILICPRCRTRIRREGVCVSGVGVLFSYFAQPEGRQARPCDVRTWMCDQLSAKRFLYLMTIFIMLLSCIIPSSHLCDFIIRDYSKYCFSYFAFGVRKTKFKLRALTLSPSTPCPSTPAQT